MKNAAQSDARVLGLWCMGPPGERLRLRQPSIADAMVNGRRVSFRVMRQPAGEFCVNLEAKVKT